MKYNLPALLSAVILLAIVLQSCSPGQPVSKQALPTPTPTPAPPSSEPTPTPIPLDKETLSNKTGKTMFKSIGERSSHAGVAMVSSKGTVVIADPNVMPKDHGLIKADIITVSHGHPDHIDSEFLAPYTQKLVPGKVSIFTTESFRVDDINVTGVPASHQEAYDPAQPSDYIYVYEIDGMRIAHTGDMYQKNLTKEQLDMIGNIDILFTSFSDIPTYGASKERDIETIKTFHPKIVLPLHHEDATTQILDALNIKDREEMDSLIVNKADLDAIKEMKYVFLK